MGLAESPLCKRCGAEDETSAHILCECEALASRRRVCLGSFLESEGLKIVILGANWNFSKVKGSLELIRGAKGRSIKVYAHQDSKVSNAILNQSIDRSINQSIDRSIDRPINQSITLHHGVKS